MARPQETVIEGPEILIEQSLWHYYSNIAVNGYYNNLIQWPCPVKI